MCRGKKLETFNSSVLPQGIPFIKDYLNLLKTDLFLEIESFSNFFIKENQCRHDPCHQWSRRWEYPFAYSYIRHYIASNSELKKPNDKFEILDAGSGFTFFPYYVGFKHANSNMHACDRDRSLVRLLGKANMKSQRYVDFKIYDLTNLGYNDNFFDIVYCLSVLEHISKHEKILEQFKRVLKPNGLLILTLDVSLEEQEKSTGEVQGLLNLLNSKFKAADTSLQTLNIGSESEILSTKFAKDFDQNSLPWALTWSSFLTSLIKLRIPRKSFLFLTVFCGVWIIEK